MLALGGLRPSEALALLWDDVNDGFMIVDKGLSLGEVGPTKTRRNRSVPVIPVLADDLAVWREHSEGYGLVFPGHDGAPWSPSAWRNWRQRQFRRAVIAAGLPEDTRPYSLLNTFVSLLIASGMDVVQVAAKAGHAPSVCMDTYGHVFAGQAAGPMDIDAEIGRARKR